MQTKRWLISVFLFFAAAAPTVGTYWERQLLKYGRMNLPVTMVTQSMYTSCGPAAVTMAYNYAYPETPVTEQIVIEYAAKAGYYNERKYPYTSPPDMKHIADFYAEKTQTGRVKTAAEGLALLTDKLVNGDPVIIDILARLDDPNSSAHFVVVTGLVLDSKNPNATRILFNDPLWGGSRSALWLGADGLWNSWLNNNEPGGSGWWMVIPSP